jgi:hypothetical protein
VPPERNGGKGRRFHAYDFFKSGSGFTDERFNAIWKDTFSFCTPERARLGLETIAAED